MVCKVSPHGRTSGVILKNRQAKETSYKSIFKQVTQVLTQQQLDGSTFVFLSLKEKYTLLTELLQERNIPFLRVLQGYQ